MSDHRSRVCPVERAGNLDNSLRRWLQNPQKILRSYVKEGMTVLDVGCGPGFFSIPMARMVGESGRVIAADVQDGMLRKLSDKILGTGLEDRINVHKCQEHVIGLAEDVDFVLAVYMIHELPDQRRFFQEISSRLTLHGQVFIAEPSFHVSKRAFETTLKNARKSGLAPVERPKMLLSKTVVLKKV